MKGDKSPQILLYLLVGALLLSTALNCYFLLRLDAWLVDQEVETQLHSQAQEPPGVSLQLPAATAAPADTVREPAP